VTIRSLFNNWISLLRLGRQVEHNPVTDNVRREILLDPQTQAMNSLVRSAVDILQDPSSPLEWPRWVEDFMRSPRHLELSGREGAETLDAWRAVIAF
jgi:hypothetical protein